MGTRWFGRRHSLVTHSPFLASPICERILMLRVRCSLGGRYEGFEMSTSTLDTGRFFEDLTELDPEFAKKIEPFLAGLYNYYFRCDISGWENIPETNALFVGNHSGLLTFEVLMLFYAWWKHFGSSRRALGVAHGIALKNPLFRWIIPKLGAIPAHPDLAY